jgi:hypothetical protein
MNHDVYAVQSRDDYVDVGYFIFWGYNGLLIVAALTMDHELVSFDRTCVYVCVCVCMCVYVCVCVCV